VSLEALRAALGRPFDPTPPTSELAGYHAPYSRLTGDDVEGTLRSELRRFGRVGVVGVSGSGKSSLVRYVADNDEALAPIYLNVAAESHDKVRNPREFLDVLITHLADTARDIARLSDERNIEQLAMTANSALDHIRAYDRVPVLVCDDTDRILRLPTPRPGSSSTASSAKCCGRSSASSSISRSWSPCTTTTARIQPSATTRRSRA
jgi:hypothetical protein